jgi:rod shape-determining protein MreB
MLHALIRRRPRRADLAVDLGTARTTVVERGSGTVFAEPSLCCFRAYDSVPAFVAAGVEAERLVGRVSRPLKMVSPLHNGVVSDMAAARELIGFATSCDSFGGVADVKAFVQSACGAGQRH